MTGRRGLGRLVPPHESAVVLWSDAVSEPTAVRFSLSQSYLLRCFPGVSPKSIRRKHAAHEPQCTLILRGSCDFPPFYMSLTTVARVGILFFPRGVSSAVFHSLPKIVQAVLDSNVTEEECWEGQKSASIRGMNETGKPVSNSFTWL